MQTELLQKDLKTVGEAISHGLGAQMVKDFQTANPTDSQGTYIGRNIIEKILAQPGCVGINFYNAINEKGEKTLVYVGVDAQGRNIVKFSVVKADGVITMEDAIVADRANPLSGGDWFEEFVLEIAGIF